MKDSSEPPAGVLVGTVSAGPIARVDVDGSVVHLADGTSMSPLVHQGDGWMTIDDAVDGQTLLDGGAIVETSYFQGAIRVRCFAEYLAGGTVVVAEVHNDGDAPIGFGWALEGDASAIAVDGTVHLDSARLRCERDAAVCAAGRGAIDPAGLEPQGQDRYPWSLPHWWPSRSGWGFVARPVSHRLAVRWILDRAAASMPPSNGSEAVSAGWRRFLSAGGPQVDVDEDGIAALHEAASVRAALGAAEHGSTGMLLRALSGDLTNALQNGYGMRQSDLGSIAGARSVLAAVGLWAASPRDEEAPEAADAAVELGAQALATLDGTGSAIDPHDVAWLAHLASTRGQPREAVRAIVERVRGAADDVGRDDDLADLALRGWDDHLVERLDRNLRLGVRMPGAFRPGTARTAGTADDAATAAAIRVMIERMLARERPDGRVDVLSPYPKAWANRSVEVWRVQLSFGKLAYGLRWHGDHPALLWELTRTAGETDSLRISAPCLSSAWQGKADRGEALVT